MAAYNETLTVLALPYAVRTNGTANGVTIDRTPAGNQYEQVTFIAVTATITDGTHTFNFEDSNDGTTWVAIPTGQRRGSIPAPTAGNNNLVYEVGLDSGKRYVRCNVVTAGATTGGTFLAVAVLSDPSNTPTR